MSYVKLQNLLKTGVTDIEIMLTMLGNEYEGTWIDEAVAAGDKVYMRLTTPVDKYVLVNYREVTMDQERGFYRVYAPGDFSGGTDVSAIPTIPMRLDAFASTAEKMIITGPVITGDPIVEVPLFGAEGRGNVPTIGDLSSESAVRIFPPSTEVLVEFENASASATYWRLNIKWWEVSPEAMPTAAEV